MTSRQISLRLNKEVSLFDPYRKTDTFYQSNRLEKNKFSSQSLINIIGKVIYETIYQLYDLNFQTTLVKQKMPNISFF